ncbi:hypothetical protein ACFFIX_17910 [Metabacillus herbersteinensis]|uniref:Uncharacterized protein n=1 Tax=Metabacillus herbersteinensis TaxID=283816 RepID=A0ABV6GI89_9BACI
MSTMIKKKHILILLVNLLGGTILTAQESNIEAFLKSSHSNWGSWGRCN